MLKKIMILSAIALFFGTGISFAQFKMENSQGLLKSAASTYTSGGVSISDLGSSTDQAVTDYLGATKEFDLGLQKAAEAFGVKNEVLEKLAFVGSLTKDNINSDDLDKARRSFQDVQEIIIQLMKETPDPSAEDKASLAESMIYLAAGIQKNMALNETIQKLSSQTQAAQGTPTTDLMAAQKIQDASVMVLVLSTTVPLDLKLEKDILSDYVAYAKANDISTPDNLNEK